MRVIICIYLQTYSSLSICVCTCPHHSRAKQRILTDSPSPFPLRLLLSSNYFSTFPFLLLFALLHWLQARGASRQARIAGWGNRPSPPSRSHPHAPCEFSGALNYIFLVKGEAGLNHPLLSLHLVSFFQNLNLRGRLAVEAIRGNQET
jgi:hypothetical protein